MKWSAQLVLCLFLILTACQYSGSFWYSFYHLSNYPAESYWQKDIEAQKKSIKRRLSQGGAWSQTLVMPEGQFFSHCFYAYSLINIIALSDSNQEKKPELVNELESLIMTIESLKSQFPWNECQKINPPGGVISLGHANYVKAGYAITGGDDKKIIDLFHAQSKELNDAFNSSSNGFLESFPGHWWPVDNYAAMESLRLHDKLYGTEYLKSTERGMARLKSNLDKKSGLMVAQFDREGNTLDVPRGCALAMSLAFRPGSIDSFSKKQYSKYQTLMYKPVFNMTGVREWLPGQTSDFKVGPVVSDIGAAASGLGIAAARANLDYLNWLKLNRGLEAISFPCHNLNGEKHYFAQNFLLGDILALWGKTICVWDQPGPYRTFTTRNKGSAEPFPAPPWTVLSLGILLSFLTAFGLFLITKKTWKGEKERLLHENVYLNTLRALSAILAVTSFIFPEVQFFPVLLTLMIISLLESLQIKFNSIISSGK